MLGRWRAKQTGKRPVTNHGQGRNGSAANGRQNNDDPYDCAAFHSGERRPKSATGRRCLELARSERVALSYSPDSEWRNRTEFIRGRDEIVAFLKRKWARELDYRLKKTLWGFRENRIAVSFEYEWHDAGGQWSRSYGNELWRFDEPA